MKKKERKATQAQYRQFKIECKILQSELGLTRYSLYFEMKDIGIDQEGDRILASIDTSEMGKCATIRLSDRYHMQFPEDFDPKRLARHEMFHLLTHRIGWLARSRYLGNTDIEEEQELLACTFENFIKNYRRRSK